MEQKTIVKELMFQYCSQGKLKRFHDLFTTTNETVSKVKLNCMKNSKGQTLLYVSCLNGHYKMSIYLLNNGADANQRCADGSTPTHAAARSCCSNLLKYMVEIGGGDLRLHDINNMTPIDWLISLDKQRNKKSLQVLQKWQHSSECTLSNQSLLSDKTTIFFPNLCNISLKSQGFGNYLISKQGMEQISTMNMCSSVIIASPADITINYKSSWAYKTPPMFEMRTAMWKGQDITVKCRKYGEVCNEDLLLNEIKSCSQLRHPNILLLMAACHQDLFEGLSYKGCNILIYERVEYGSLYHLLHSDKDNKLMHDNILSEVNLLKYMIQISQAITFLHEQNLVHGAISSHAVHIVCQDIAKLSDFICIGHVDSAKYLNEDVMAYLARWLCPTAFVNEYFTTNFDVYSFCLVITECFSKKIPWASISSATVAHNMKQNQLDYVIPAEIPNDLRNVLHKGISAHKNNKYLFRISDLGFVLQQLINEKTVDNASLAAADRRANTPYKGLDVPDSTPIIKSTNKLQSPNGFHTGDTTTLVTACDSSTKVADETLPFNDKVIEPKVKKTTKNISAAECLQKENAEALNPLKLKQVYHGMYRSTSMPLRKDHARITRPKVSLTNSKSQNSPLCSQVQRVQSLLSEMSTIFSQNPENELDGNCARFIAVSPPNTQFVPDSDGTVAETIDVVDGVQGNQHVNLSDDNIDAQFHTINQTLSDKSVVSERRFSIGSQDLEDIFEDFATRDNSSSRKSSSAENFESGRSNLSNEYTKSPSFEVHYTCLRITDPIIRNKRKELPPLYVNSVNDNKVNDNDVSAETKVKSPITAKHFVIPEVKITESNNMEDVVDGRAYKQVQQEDESVSINETIPANDFVTCMEDSKVDESNLDGSCVKNNAACQTNVSFSMGEMQSKQELQAIDKQKQARHTHKEPTKPTKSKDQSAMSALKHYHLHKAMYPQTPSKWPFQKKLQLFQKLGTDKDAKAVQAIDFNDGIASNFIQNGNMKNIAIDGNDPVTPVMTRTTSLLAETKGVKTSTPVPRCNALLQKQMDSRIALSELQRKMEFTLSTVQNDTTNSEQQTKPNDRSNFKVQFDENECLPKIKILNHDEVVKNLSQHGLKSSNEESDCSNTSSNDSIDHGKINGGHKSSTNQDSSSCYNSENDQQEDLSEGWSMYYNTSANVSLLDILVDDLAESIATSVIKEEVAALAKPVQNMA